MNRNAVLLMEDVHILIGINDPYFFADIPIRHAVIMLLQLDMAVLHHRRLFITLDLIAAGRKWRKGGGFILPELLPPG